VAIDVGSVRVGVAVCDARAAMAFPLTVLSRDQKAGHELDDIRVLAREREAIELIVGLPRSLSGSEGPAAQLARDYAARLAAVTGLPVRLVDERLSTVEAGRQLQASGRTTRQARDVVDAAAAVVILESALGMERSTGRPPGLLVSEGSQ
jgi:putative Holliday junction resolvase